MTLIRGFGGKCPCPVCLVPDNLLSQLLLDFPLRTTTSMKSILTQAKEMGLQIEKEEIYKSVGLRGIVVHLFYQFGN
jgi:hypothetical protein